MSSPTAYGQPPPPARTAPAVDKSQEAYWTGGEHGELRIFRCQACAYYVHPPVGFCPRCEARDVRPEAVSGRGRVRTFTVNHKAWTPGLPVPYVVALVALDEQEDIQIPCNIVNCPAEAVIMDMPVKVLFEQVEDIWVPLFAPDTGA